MNKKAQGLPLSTIIVAILVIVVLIVVLIFFLGGMGGMSTKIKSIFFGATAGVDKSLAIEYCRQYCISAQSLPESARGSSSFCKKYFYIDEDNDGEADKDANGNLIQWYCFEASSVGNVKYLGVSCEGVECKPIIPQPIKGQVAKDVNA